MSPWGLSYLFLAWCGGGETVLDTLMPLVYGELHQLTFRYPVAEQPQTVALVN